MNKLVWKELSRSALKHNIDLFRKIVGRHVILAPCVKSNAYGHGIAPVAALCQDAGVEWLCINSVDEALLLRSQGISLPLLVMGAVADSDYDLIPELDTVSYFVYTREQLAAFEEIGKQKNCVVPIHLKIDTGMHRQGIGIKDISEFILRLQQSSHISVGGVATHFATADEAQNDPLFISQQKNFKESVEVIRKYFPDVIVHAANSAAALWEPQTHYDLIRFGISLYGYYPSSQVKQFCEEHTVHLKPVLMMKTQVVQVKELREGESVSYGATFTAKQSMKIAVLPIGYADGLDRHLSNKGLVEVNGRPAPIIGRICMNLTMIDISDCGAVSEGDEVVVMGGSVNSVETIAQSLDTIEYEVTARLRESIETYLVP